MRWSRVALAVAFLVFGSSMFANEGLAQSVDFNTAQARALEFSLKGDFAGALQWAERSLAIAEREAGPRSALAATAHWSIAVQQQSSGHLKTAEQHYREGLAIQERLVPEDDISLARFAAGLGGLFYGQGRYDAAEPFMRKSLRLQETYADKTGDVSGLAVALYLLGSNYTNMHRLDEGLRLLERSLAIFEKILPQGGVHQAYVLNNLANNRQLAGDYAAAADHQQRALQLFEKFTPENLPALAKVGNNLGFLYEHAGNLERAEEQYRLAIGKLEKAFPTGHPDIATARANYGSLLVDLDRLEEAEAMLSSAVDMRRQWLPADHVENAIAHELLGSLFIKRTDWTRAAQEYRAAAEIYVARAARQEAGRGSVTRNDIEANAASFANLIKTEWRRSPVDDGRSFVMAQHAIGSSAAAALAQMATRSAGHDQRLAGLVRDRQDLVAAWHVLDKELVAALSKSLPQQAEIDAVRQRLGDVDAKISLLDGKLAASFPEFADLARPKPLGIAEVQAELGGDEALVVLFVTGNSRQLPEETFTWVVTKHAVRWLRSMQGAEALQREVTVLRCGLDASAWSSDNSSCPALTGETYSEADRAAGNPLLFDTSRAHAIYASLLGGAADLIEGKQLLVVASGALTTLPFQVLVKEPPRSNDFAAARWLVRDHAITVLPSVSSLAALRRTGKPSAAPKPMIGFGNPLLDGNQTDPVQGDYFRELAQVARSRTGCARSERKRTAALRHATRSLDATVLASGQVADLDHLRRQSPLPETADELCEVVRSVGGGVESVRIGARATEAEVKRLSASGELANYRMLHFATHGTLAGQLEGTSEPGLILSPPATATAVDDGFLSGSEIAALKLDADWVILSACNTAGGAGAGEAAEALSGLARVFFYAGARAMLVSHWEVDSDAAVRLVTGAIGELAKDHKLGRAEALRRAMLAMMSDTSRPAAWVPAAHPSVWAPFVVVGEGGTGR